MDYSIFLAQIFGIYLIVMGIFFIIRRPFLQKAAEEFYNSPALILFSGALSLMIGLFIVAFNPVFAWHWSIVITLLGILAIAKGFIRLFVLSTEKKLFQKLMQGKNPVICGSIMLLIGLFLSYYGFVYFPV